MLVAQRTKTSAGGQCRLQAIEPGFDRAHYQVCGVLLHEVR